MFPFPSLLTRQEATSSFSNQKTAAKTARTAGGIKNKSIQENGSDEATELGWLPAFPHALVASLSNFLFGYHIGVMNGPIASIAKELGSQGNSFLQGLLVSTFIGGAFIGSIRSGLLVDKLGFQVDTIPLVLGAIIR